MKIAPSLCIEFHTEQVFTVCSVFPIRSSVACFYKYRSEYCPSTTLSTYKAHACRCYQGHVNGENSPHYFQEKRGCLEKNFPTLEKIFSCLEKIFSRHGKKFSRHGNCFENIDGATKCFLALISGMARGFFRRMRTIIKPPV